MDSAPFRPLATLALLTVLAGCAVGPTYRRPTLAVPDGFKETAGWKQAQPNDAARGSAWWEALQDPELNALEQEVATANQSLLQAAANYEQARELARADRATFWPSLSAEGSAQRSQTGARGGAASTTGGLTLVSPAASGPTNLFAASLDASWTPDFWGKIRRLTEADVAAAQSSAATLAAARLSTQASVAQDYIGVRLADEKIRLLEAAVEGYRHTLSIAQNKYNVGVAAKSDVISAHAQLDAAVAQQIDAGIQRAQLEHALAVLVGKAPSQLTIARRPAPGLTIPSIPLALPSELLERRPDVASAEREAAEANARVGIQTAAYFPTVTLSGNGGYEGSPLDTLFSAPDRFWTLGANVSETLLDFGQRRAQLQEARAAYEGTAANYRQTVLAAFQQVEDDLAALRILEREAGVEDTAVSEASQAASIALNEYHAGTVDYTTVVTAQINELTDREAALTILQNRLDSSVALMQALGGGWSAEDLPSRGQVMARHSQAGAAVAAPK